MIMLMKSLSGLHNPSTNQSSPTFLPQKQGANKEYCWGGLVHRLNDSLPSTKIARDSSNYQ